MNYKKKRNKAGISFTTMVQYLGIPEKKYKEVEKGKRSLEGNYLDKFMEAINKGKELKMQETIKEVEIQEWIKSGQILKDMKDYGYSQGQLSKAIGIAQSTVNGIIHSNKNVSKDLKLKVYNFLHDTLNKKIVEETKNDDFYINWCLENVERIVRGKKLKQTDIEADLGVSHGYISHLMRKDNKPSKYLAKKIYDYFNNKKTTAKAVIPNLTIPKVEVPKFIEEPKENKVTEKLYTQEQLDEKINKITYDYEAKLLVKDAEIKQCKRQISMYEKLIERL